MKFSILLRTRNSERELEKFYGRAGHGDEIVIVDHSSTDDTVKTAAEAGAKIVRYGDAVFSYGAALNAGLPLCTKEWVLVASPHFEPGVNGFWEQMAADLRDLPEDVAACQFPIFLANPSARPGITFIGPADLKVIPWHIYGNTCCAYRRELLDEFLFDERLPTAEDLEWCFRVVKAGYRIGIDHRVPVIYRNRAPIARYWRRGRADFPTVAKIFGTQARPKLTGIFRGFAGDGWQLISAQIPFWLWIRLTVKRTAELTLVLG